MRRCPLYIASAVFAASFASSAFAADCSCSVAGNSIAQVSNAQGTVFISGRDGFVPATKGMKISQGMQLVTGADAAAKVAFTSGCQTNVAANQSLQIVKAADNKICVKVSNLLAEGQVKYGQVIPAGGAAAGGLGGVGISGLVFTGVAIGAVGSAVATEAQSDDVAPGTGPISQ